MSTLHIDELFGRAGILLEPVCSCNSLIDGSLPDPSHWEHLDFSRASADPGPSPAGNSGTYMHVPCTCERLHGPDGVTHRIYARAAALPGVRVGVAKGTFAGQGEAERWAWFYEEDDDEG